MKELFKIIVLSLGILLLVAGMGQAQLLSSGWAKFHNDTNNTGVTSNKPVNEFNSSYNLSLKWKYNVSNDVTLGYIYSSPTIGELNQTLWVGVINGTGAATDPSKVYVFWLNGTKKCSFNTNASVESSIALDTNETGHFGDYLGWIYALNNDCSLKWAARPATNPMGTSFNIDPQDGILYYGSDNGYIYAIYPENGTVKWSFRNAVGDVVTSSLGVDVGEDVVYYGVTRSSGQEYLHSVYRGNGSIRLSSSTAKIDYSSPVIVKNGFVLIGANSYFYVFYPNQTLRGTISGIFQVKSASVVDYTNDTFYFCDIQGDCYSYWLTNMSQRWVKSNGTLLKSGTWSSAALTGNNMLVLGDDANIIHVAYANNGTEFKNFTARNKFRSSPAVDANGDYYVGGYDGFLYALTYNPLPSFSSWGNNKTSNSSLNVEANTSNYINFNATPDQTANSWEWYVDDINQNTNQDNFSSSFTNRNTWANTDFSRRIDNYIPNGTRPFELDLTLSNGTGANTNDTLYGNGNFLPNISDYEFRLNDNEILSSCFNNYTGKTTVNVTGNGTVSLYFSNSSKTFRNNTQGCWGTYPLFYENGTGVNTTNWRVHGSVIENNGLVVTGNNTWGNNGVDSQMTFSRAFPWDFEVILQTDTVDDGMTTLGTKPVFDLDSGITFYPGGAAPSATKTIRYLDTVAINWVTSSKSANTNWYFKIALKQTQGYTIWDRYDLDSAYTQREDNTVWATDNVRMQLGQRYYNAKTMTIKYATVRHNVSDPSIKPQWNTWGKEQTQNARADHIVQAKATNSSNGTSNFLTWNIAMTAAEVAELSYIPPTPINIVNTTYNFGKNMSWEAGSGNVTNGYNISRLQTNGTTWYNITDTKLNTTTIPHGCINDTIYAWNSSNGGTLSAGVVSNTCLANNPPVLQAIGNSEVNEGQWKNVSLIATDLDGDPLTNTTNATKGTLSGNNYNWSVLYNESGIYAVSFTATDNNSGSDSEVVVITVNNILLNITSTTPTTPVSTMNGTAQTFSADSNRTTNFSWEINGSVMQTNTSVTTASYTNSTAGVGMYNLTLIITDTIDTNSTTWLWNVTTVPSFPISGYVIDNNGDALSSVTVANGSNSSNTNVQGYYEITGMSNGTFNLTFSKTGFDTTYLEVTITGAGQTNQNKTVNDTTPPSQVTGMASYSPFLTKANISWGGVSGANFYQVFRNGTHTAYTQNIYYNDTVLSPNTLYQYIVRANDTYNNWGANSTVLDVTTAGTPNITSWGNNKTDNYSFSMTLNISEYINFNATANQSIITWGWYKDNVSQSHNFDNFSTSWAAGTTKTIKVNGTNANGTTQTITWVVTINDTSPPASITSLTSSVTKTTVTWSWSSPTDSDYNYTNIYLDGVFKSNSSSTSYEASSLSASTSYTISTRTVDTSGNINGTWANNTATTSAQSTTGSSSSSITGGNYPGENEEREEAQNLGRKDYSFRVLFVGADGQVEPPGADEHGITALNMFFKAPVKGTYTIILSTYTNYKPQLNRSLNYFSITPSFDLKQGSSIELTSDKEVELYQLFENEAWKKLPKGAKVSKDKYRFTITSFGVFAVKQMEKQETVAKSVEVKEGILNFDFDFDTSRILENIKEKDKEAYGKLKVKLAWLVEAIENIKALISEKLNYLS